MSMYTGLDKKFCTTREAAGCLGVSLRTAQLWSESGALDAWKTKGGHRRISVASVERVLERRRAVVVSRERSIDQLKVLVVEDDNVLLKLYKLCLSAWGLPLKVFTASNAYEALVLIGRESPDLMISDLRMDGLDGCQMIRKLMNSPLKEGMEIVAVSGLHPSEIEALGGLPPEAPIFGKPVPFDQIRLVCENLLERRRQGMSGS